MPQEINKLKVLINGREYTLVSERSKEHIQKVASYADSKTKEIAGRSTSSKYSTSRLAVITSLNIAEDYVILKDEFETLSKQAQANKNELGALRHKFENLQQEYKKLQNDLEASKRENVKMKTFMEAKGLKYFEKK